MVALSDNRPAETSSLTARAASDRQLTLHISYKLRNRVALAKLLDDQQNPASPRYHRWLTPAQFDARFGRTPAEVQALSKWLSQRGIRVVRSSSREMLSTTTVAQAEAVFATSIMASADGARFANSAAPYIPARLSDVIGSIEGLDNLRHYVPVTRAPSESLRGNLTTPAAARPAAAGGTAFGPQDVWTFYHQTPPLNGVTDGSGGDCLAVIEDSDYPDAAITKFDGSFSLPSASVTREFSDATSPGTNSDETEALVDIEWAHAIAPGAPIRVYIGRTITQKIDPLTDSLLLAVSDNTCGTISFTFVFCGAPASFYTTTIGNAMTQAAAQGQSVLAASGDWGSAGLVAQGNSCVPGTTQNANEVAANPNVTGVGGTQFTPIYDSGGNDIGNVPETAWADAQAASGIGGATGGGKSAIFAKPSYQNASTPNDGARDFPDVALAASDVTPGFCWVDGDATSLSCGIGGTSVATPIWAGLTKLIAEIGGGRLGNINPRIYQLGALGSTSQSGLRDVVMGNNAFNGAPGFRAVVGYDQTTGWGTPDVQTLESVFLATATSPTPTMTATATATASATATAIATGTATATAVVTSTATPTTVPTVTATTIATPTATSIPTVSPTAAPTPASVAPKIVAPTALDLGSVAIGLSTGKGFVIRNSGKANLVGNVQMLIAPPSGASVFTVTPPSFNIPPGGSMPETVTFQPDALNDSATALIGSNDPTQPTMGVLLSGAGLAGRLSVPRTFMITGPAGQTIEANLTIKNVGKGFLSGTWTPVAIPPYSIAGGSFGPLQPGTSADIPIDFSPSAKGPAPSVALAVEVVGPSTGGTVVTLTGMGK